VNVLFYIEPAVFRNNPSLFVGWRERVDAFAAHLAPDWSVALATSPYICSLRRFGYNAVFTLDPNEVMAWCDNDRLAYSQDLYTGKAEANHYLLERLNDMRTQFSPDIVISWSENSYLKKVFPGKAFFIEYGPLPRHELPVSIFLDPFGHQHDCAFSRALAKPKDIPSPPEVIAHWNHWRERVMLDAKEMNIPTWLEARTAGRKVNLLALQPTDWMTYEAAGVSKSPADLIRQVADDVGPDVIVLPQFHPSSELLSKELCDEICTAHPNVLFTPSEFMRNHSELFLPFVDGLTTISSNVAVPAAVLGKTVRVLGKCKMSVLESAAPTPRMDVWEFLLSYCSRVDTWTDSDALKVRLTQLYEDPNSILKEDKPLIFI